MSANAIQATPGARQRRLAAPRPVERPPAVIVLPNAAAAYEYFSELLAIVTAERDEALDQALALKLLRDRSNRRVTEDRRLARLRKEDLRE